ncbi:MULTISPECIES: hypothetical protein [unclassified Acinetobacter]|uniref:hypothetical protein n=1 Tax=unclassified Acinetobacter TaxID=196816 RepID=UPI000A35571A|nr:hypothetical protein [Acinetobacter sp. ANC 4218]OTG73652.1 hypothetical protein B9T38_04400 [Acinetobacter sp. ANC 4218]
MPPLDEYAVNSQQIENGVVMLKKRQRNVMLWAITSSTIFLASVVAFFLQHDFVYSFFGITTELKQLHIPLSVDANLAELGQHRDYFSNLLSWFGWLILKLLVSFMGAFFVIHFLKKIRFFYVRFQSFILKFVGWIIAFIMLWSGLTCLQYDLNNEENDAYREAIHYDKNIQQSELAQYLQRSEVDEPVKAYLLAQTALLHQPIDKDSAIPQVLALVKAEKTDPDFFEYGFKPEQLWTMQHQLYGQSLTPMAKIVSRQVTQAEQMSSVVQILIIAASILFGMLSAILLLLSQHLKRRIFRVEQRMQLK